MMTSDAPVFDLRELDEIKLAMFYAEVCGHGTTGHNRLMLIAKMAHALGFTLVADIDGNEHSPNAAIKLERGGQDATK